MDLQFDANFLNHILVQSIVDTDFLKRIINNISIDTFQSKERKFLVKLIFDYFREFKKAPDTHFYDLLKENKNKISDKLYDRVLDLVGVLKNINHTNPEFLISRIGKAVKHFQLEEAAVLFAQNIKMQKYEEAEKVILKALRQPSELNDEYFDFFEDTEYIERRLAGKQFRMKNLIEGFCDLVPGFNATWLITILGATKGGKTAFLIDLAVCALMQGLKVCFVTLEMSKSDVTDRFDQCIGFFSTEEHRNKIETMEYVNKQWVKIKKNVDTIYNLDKVKKARKAIRKMGGDLYIADYSGGKANYHTIETLLDTLETQEGKIFDILLVDYLGIMGAVEKGQSKKERIADNCLGLRGIGKDRNLVVFTAAQGNRQAMGATTLNSNQIADAIEPIFDSDLVPAICQTAAEEKNNIYRIYIAEFRHGKKHDYIKQVRDLTIGQMSLGIATDNLIVKEPDEEKTKLEDTY
jgi:replicative DNA helicase